MIPWVVDNPPAPRFVVPGCVVLVAPKAKYDYALEVGWILFVMGFKANGKPWGYWGETLAHIHATQKKNMVWAKERCAFKVERL